MKKERKLLITLQLFLMLISLFAVVSSFGYDMYQIKFPRAFYIKDVRVSIDGGAFRDITLPYTFKNLKKGTRIEISSPISPNEDDLIYIKTAYAPARVYADGKLIYELGKKESYPDYMIDPATEIYLAPPYVYDREVEFKMEFLSPKSRNSMTVHPPIMSTFRSLFLEMLKTYRTSFFFSVVQLGAGVFLALIAALLYFFERKISSIVFWLGLFSFTSGLWAFGECNFTALMIKNPTMLYLFAFIGFISLAVPLIQLSLSIVDFKNPKPLFLLSAFMTVSALIALALQLLGLYQLSSSMYAFHIITPLSLCMLTFFTLFEAFRYKNLQAKRFLLPILILTLFSLIEVINYYVRFTYKFASLFQDGIILFILVMGFTIGFYIRDIAAIRKQNERLAFEVGLMSIQMEEQKKYNELIRENEEALKKQRHDLRHHLVAIREFAGNENEELKSYLNSLIENVPTGSELYCKNKAVNAIVSHYAKICKNENVKFDSKLIIPEIKTASFNGDLSVIFGNLLENAIEACRRTGEGERFIRISSDIDYELLVITMDNSYDGHFTYEGERFRSSKREDFGVGLSSVLYTARKYQGDAKFEGKDGNFQSSVYMNIGKI